MPLDAESVHLRLIAELADLAIWRHDFATDRIHFNAHGYRVLEIEPRPGGLTLADARAGLHPDDVSTLVAAAARALATGEPNDVQLRHARRDGGWRHLLVRRVLERAPDGTPIGFAGVTMDVSERHRAQSALHAAATRVALIAREAGIGTWQTDAGGAAIWDEQMWRLRGLVPGRTPPDREGRIALVHPDDRERLFDIRPGAYASAAPTASEFRVRQPDGSYRWLASRSTPLFDPHGTVIGRIGVNWDVTDAKTTEAARQQAALAERESRAKSALFARLSHELRTPMNAVLGFTQLLESEARGGRAEVSAATLGHLRAAGEHLLSLIDGALDAAGAGEAAGTIASGAAAAAPGRAAPTAASNPVLLYVEDNPVNALLIEELVKLRPHLRLVGASDGTGGVAAAIEHRPGLALIDMQLPDFDGFEVLRRLRSDPRTAAVRCIALSANVMPDDVQRALDAGFEAYWTKPVRFGPFLDGLDRLLPKGTTSGSP